MLCRQAELESSDGHVLKIALYLVEHLPISIWVCFQSFSFSRGQRYQRSQRMRSSVACNKTGPKRLGKFLKGTDGTYLQTIKPPHRHRPQTGWKNFAHQDVILGVYNHLLIKVTNMFNRVRFAVIQGESGFNEPLRKSSLLNLVSEGWFGNLVECFAHSVIYQASRRRIVVSASMVVIFFIRERFVGGSSWPSPIVFVLLIIRRVVRIGRSPLSALVT